MEAEDGRDEVFLADVAAYLDAHEPLQTLWGVDLFDDLVHESAVQAFSAPPTALVSDMTTTPCPSSSSNTAGDTASDTPGSSDQQNQRPVNQRVRNISRERQQRELQELRLQCAELEQKLRTLQQNQNELETPTPQKTLLLATWKRVVERQLELRTQAEQENWRLVEKTQQQQLIALNLQHTLRQWSSIVNEETPAPVITTQRPTQLAVTISSAVDPGDVEIYRKLLSEVDSEHHRMDSVMRENGLAHWHVATRTSTMHMKTRSRASSAAKGPSLYIELMEADAIPFEIAMVFKVSWQCWLQRKIPAGSAIYEHFSQPFSHDTSETILSKVRFDMVANGQSVFMDLLCVVRAYVEHDRISYVLRGVTKADDHFPGVYIDETDWWLIKPSEHGNAATETFTCAHMETKHFDNCRIGGDDLPVSDVSGASPLATLCASVYEADMDEASDMMLNMLLSCSGSTSVSCL